jgi:predicted transcriptional regulator
MALKAIQEAHDAIFAVHEYINHLQAAGEELTEEVENALFDLKEACNELLNIID